eukprot:TRINITY_DN2196_c0_g1_i2.p1 TRINITY_DN2196_c0_g1~~TRINITY_DN2196_c0_g1_i2.p1  ORF type:complete len:603 (-),score=125.86 TRINITY_DN2196_c0_g1_i2:18-1826(-)
MKRKRSSEPTRDKSVKKQQEPFPLTDVNESDSENEPEDDNANGEDEVTRREKEQERGEDSDDSLLYDSEDSENDRNLMTIGDVPLEWYEDYDHFGYDLEGNPVTKPKQRNEIDEFISMNETPGSWKQVFNEKTGKNVFLSQRDLNLIKQLRSSKLPKNYSFAENFVELDHLTDTVHPLGNYTEPKRRFIPSKHEMKRIQEIRKAIRYGWIKIDDKDKAKKAQEKKQQFYDIWADTSNVPPPPNHIIPAPKVKLPGHNESYNPPAEYLLDEAEKKSWELMDPSNRPFNFLPTKYPSMRLVPAYPRFLRERFERCLDLYLCKRVRPKRPKVSVESLIPKLPNPQELRPFPTTERIRYLGHEGRVRSITVDPIGQYLVSASDDQTIRLWEIETGRCINQWKLPGVVHRVAFNPNTSLCLFAAIIDKSLYLIDPGIGNEEQNENTDQLFAYEEEAVLSEKLRSFLVWREPSLEESDEGIKAIIEWNWKESDLRHIAWHHKGDYIATTATRAQSLAVVIHQLSKRQSHNPFKKAKGIVQLAKFHPTKPYFFVATQRLVRMYNLAKQSMTKKLEPGIKWISSMDIHPKGNKLAFSCCLYQHDNLIYIR